MLPVHRYIGYYRKGLFIFVKCDLVSSPRGLRLLLMEYATIKSFSSRHTVPFEVDKMGKIQAT